MRSTRGTVAARRPGGGARDTIVPIEYGERLFGLAREPKRFARFPQGEHEDLDRFGALATVKTFLDDHFD